MLKTWLMGDVFMNKEVKSKNRADKLLLTTNKEVIKRKRFVFFKAKFALIRDLSKFLSHHFISN